ncbi:MAG: PEP-CTERM sorting domain-containing protein [Pirellulales bacterium]
MKGSVQCQRVASLLGFACLVLVPSLVQAAPINYGDFMGDTVRFLDVTEDSVTDPNTALYGAPTVTGNSLDFDPVSFNAFATGAGGLDLTDGTLSLVIEAKPGQGILSLVFNEAGDYTLLGFGSDNTLASVRAPFFINILEVDGTPIQPINIQAVMEVAPDNGQYRLVEQGGGPLQQGNWTGKLMVDVAQEITDAGHSFLRGATKLSVTLDNTLSALSEEGTSAFIAKKDFGGTSITVIGGEIPEPSTVVLLLAGMLGITAFQRKQR